MPEIDGAAKFRQDCLGEMNCEEKRIGYREICFEIAERDARQNTLLMENCHASAAEII